MYLVFSSFFPHFMIGTRSCSLVVYTQSVFSTIIMYMSMSETMSVRGFQVKMKFKSKLSVQDLLCGVQMPAMNLVKWRLWLEFHSFAFLLHTLLWFFECFNSKNHFFWIHGIALILKIFHFVKFIALRWRFSEKWLYKVFEIQTGICK